MISVYHKKNIPMAYFHEVSSVLHKCLGMDAFTTQGLAHKVHEYMRHDTAQLLCDAWKQDKLRLKYVRRFMIRESLLYKDDIHEHLAPSVCCSTVYGDHDAPMCIIRTHISMAERVKLRFIGDNKCATA